MEFDSKIKTEHTDELFEAILALENLEECYRFFEDLCTIREMQSISQRMVVAKLLKEKKTYKEIENQTGASTATISRANRALMYGAGGYDLIFKRLGLFEETEEE